MTSNTSFSFEDVIERLDELNMTMKRIAAALETIAQTVSPEIIEAGKTQRSERGKKEGKQKRTYSSAKELITVIKEEAPTLHGNIKDTKRFPSGDFIVKIDYVDNDTFKQIAHEAEKIGGKYSRKYRGFIFKMGE